MHFFNEYTTYCVNFLPKLPDISRFCFVILLSFFCVPERRFSAQWSGCGAAKKIPPFRAGNRNLIFADGLIQQGAQGVGVGGGQQNAGDLIHGGGGDGLHAVGADGDRLLHIFVADVQRELDHIAIGVLCLIDAEKIGIDRFH